MTQITITVPDDLGAFLQGAAESAKLFTPDQAVVDALYDLKTRSERRNARFESIKREVLVGVEQADRGESSPWDIDEIKADIQKRYNQLS